MKKIFYIFLTLIIVAACNKETGYMPDTTLYTEGTVNLCASIEEIMTRIVVDQSGRGLWTEGDKIAVACDDGSFVEFELNGTGETKRAIFTGEIPAGRTLGKIAVWPANAVVSLDGDELTLKTPTEYSSDNIAFDGIMVADISDSWEITFRHVMARPIIKIVGLPSYTSYITIEAEGYSLGGRVTMNLADKDGVKAVRGSRSLTISLVEAGTSLELPLNFPVADYTKLTATLYDENDKLIHTQQINDMTLSLSRATTTYVTSKLIGVLERYDPVDVEYVEVCGIKWAKGNLQVKQGTKQKGMQDGWGIAPAQWHFFKYKEAYDYAVKTRNGEPARYDYNNSTTEFEHFTFGALARNAKFYSDGSGNWMKPAEEDLDIQGKIYGDRNGVNELSGRERWANPGTFTSSNSEIYGDLAFWASRGAYMTPTYEQLNKLYTEADIQFGYVLDGDVKIWGIYFSNPKTDAAPTRNNVDREITASELESGVFLPKAGRRANSGSGNVISATQQCTYRSSTHYGYADYTYTTGTLKGQTLNLGYAYSLHFPGKDELLNDTPLWQKGGAYDNGAGFLIRPIVNENYDPDNI